MVEDSDLVYVTALIDAILERWCAVLLWFWTLLRANRIVPATMFLLAVVGCGGRGAQDESVEREALIKRNAAIAAKAQADAASAARQAAGRFSAMSFAVSLNPIDAKIKHKDYLGAKLELDMRMKELLAVQASDRKNERGVAESAKRLNSQERVIMAGLLAIKNADDEANSISAYALFSEFEANEIRANQTYKGKTFRVRGAIDSIGTDILGTPYIALKASDLFTVQGMFAKGSADARLASLSKDQIVILNCRVDGKLGNVIMRDCSIE